MINNFIKSKLLLRMKEWKNDVKEWKNDIKEWENTFIFKESSSDISFL